MDGQIPVPKLSVVMPVYNECRTIQEILRRVQAVAVDKEIIIVDDGSADGSREILQALAAAAERDPSKTVPPSTGETLAMDNVRVLFQPRNHGKGAALRRGFELARGQYVIVQDADLELDPEDYHKLLEPVERGLADVVYGSRILAGSRRVLFFWHSLGNKFMTLISNMFTNLALTDVWTGYKLFRRDCLQQLNLKEDRFGFEPEVTAKVAKKQFRVYEVPISYQGRTYAEGKKINWKDGVWGIWCVLRYNLFD